MQFLFPVLALLALLASFGSAQQFQGTVTTYNMTLANVSGSEIAYFRIIDNKNRQFTSINYLSTTSSGNRLVPANIQRVVIVIHGLARDPDLYMSNMLSALPTVSMYGVNTSNTQIIAPYFPNGDDKNHGFPWDASQPSNNRSWSDILVWEGSGWIGGSNNQYPYHQISTSSYDVIDQYLTYYGNTA